MKNRILLFVAGCIALMLSSCLDSDEREYEMVKDCQITSFSLKSDSVPGLDTVRFTIDQLNGRIFNMDSMPYGTEIEKVICSVTFASGVFSSEVTQDAFPDSTFSWNKEDSLDFSKPVKFVNSAYDGLTKKVYIAQVNVHQVVPDSMVWSLYAEKVVGFPMKEQKVITWGAENDEYYYMYVQSTDVSKGYSLYISSVSDAKNWRELVLTGLPAGEVRLSQITEYENRLYVPTAKGTLYQSANGQDWTLVSTAPVVKTLMGKIKGGGQSQSSALVALAEMNGSLVYATMNKEAIWATGEVVPTGFPVNGFSGVSHESMFRQRLLVVAGRDKDDNLLNSAWATMNGLSWALLTDLDADYFSKREGVMLSAYDNKFCLIGGIDAAGKASKEMYFSADDGVSWTLSDTLTVMPVDYKARGYASVQVDKEKNMLIFGGKESIHANVMDQIWRGRINRLGFKQQ